MKTMPCQGCGSVEATASKVSLMFLVLTVGGAWGLWKLVQYLDKG